MLPKQYRLPLRERFTPEFQVYSPMLSLKVRSNASGQSRFAFIVSKRVAKQAVDRNRTKRVLRRCMEERLHQVKPGYDMLFVAKQAFSGEDAKTTCQEVDRMLQKKSLKV